MSTKTPRALRRQVAQEADQEDKQSAKLKKGIARTLSELEARMSGRIVAFDYDGADFLHYVGPHVQSKFIEHLRSGHIRAAFALVADGAFRCGLLHSSTLFGAKRIRKVRTPDGYDEIEYLPQRVPPEIGIILGAAYAAKVARADLGKVLRAGGRVLKWGMRSPVSLPKMSAGDTAGILASWPYRSRRGRPKSRRA